MLMSNALLQAAYSRNGGSDNRGSDHRSGESAEQLRALAMLSGATGMLTSNGVSSRRGSQRSNSGSSLPSGGTQWA